MSGWREVPGDGGGPAAERNPSGSGRGGLGDDKRSDDPTPGRPAADRVSEGAEGGDNASATGHAGRRPVGSPGDAATGDSAAAADPSWAQERLVREFMQRPEGRVEAGTVVIRPSLWAALERGLVAFAGISVFVLPFVIAAVFGVGDPSPDEPRFVVVFEVVQGLILPLLFSLVPVVQLAFTRYIIDEEGIRERVQLVSRTDKRVRWEKVTALQHRITLMDRLFRIQRINVIAYGARGTTIRLVGLRGAPRLRRLVAKQMRVNASFDRLLTND